MIKIKTSQLKNLVAKSEQGATNEKLLPLTSLVCIEVQEGKLSLTTTDSSNVLIVTGEVTKVDEEFYAVVPVDIFSKLIQRTTSSEVVLTVDDSVLSVHGTGTHKIPLVMDEGGVVKFPTVKFIRTDDVETVAISDIKNIIAINGPSLAKTYDIRCLCSYFVGENVITSNDQVACFNSVPILREEALLSQRMVKLLSLVEEKTVDCHRVGNMFYFETPNFKLIGPEAEGREEFPAVQLSEYVEEAMPNICSIKKKDLLEVIKRLELFIEPYDKNGAHLEFGSEYITVRSKRDNSHEIVRYHKTDFDGTFKCCIDIPMLKEQLEAIDEETVDIAFGNESAIRLQGNGVFIVISLLDDEDL